VHLVRVAPTFRVEAWVTHSGFGSRDATVRWDASNETTRLKGAGRCQFAELQPISGGGGIVQRTQTGLATDDFWRHQVLLAGRLVRQLVHDFEHRFFDD
jgi:hypothetical protein